MKPNLKHFILAAALAAGSTTIQAQENSVWSAPSDYKYISSPFTQEIDCGTKGGNLRISPYNGEDFGYNLTFKRNNQGIFLPEKVLEVYKASNPTNNLGNISINIEGEKLSCTTDSDKISSRKIKKICDDIVSLRSHYTQICESFALLDK